MNRRGTLAISQIMILIIGIIAISYAVGSSVGEVRGELHTLDIPPVPNNDFTIGSGDIENYYTPEDIIERIKPPEIPKNLQAAVVPTHDKVGIIEGIFQYREGTFVAKGGEILANGKVAEAGQIIPKEGAGAFTSGGWVDGIVSGAAWGVTAYFIAQMIGPMLGLEPETVNAASMALGWGFGVGRGIYSLTSEGNLLEGMTEWFGGVDSATLGWGAGVIAAAVIFYFMYEKTEQKIVTFECKPWDAPTGGNDCEKCNGQELPCSLYQCKSLGQACDLVNEEESGEAKCVWVNRKDVNPPIIQPWNDALLDTYKYTPDNTISPPDKGVNIINEDSTKGCVPAFTPMSFGINTDEPAKCKLDYIRKKDFDEMNFFFGGSSLFKYNHTQVMSLPGPTAETNGTPIIQNDGSFELFTRCMDANGNQNTGSFVFKYCVEKGPDTTPPIIVTTNLLNGMPIAYEQTEIDLEVYTNEPSECKWTHDKDKDFKDLENTMSCSSSIFEMNAQMLYKCSTTLTGLKDRQENNFYFRCKDKPLATSDRNAMSEGYKFTLVGTQPLILDWVKPNETIIDSTEVIKVELEAKTSAGYDKGKANCYFSKTDDDSYVLFSETNSYEHTQRLDLPEGSYHYFIKCVDLGGNSDTKEVSFSVESDTKAPIITRAYKEESHLKIITNEKSECVYGIDTCNYPFEEGIALVSVDELEHFVDWDTSKSLYIKCADQYGKQPNPNECSIVVRPFQSFEIE